MLQPTYYKICSTFVCIIQVNKTINSLNDEIINEKIIDKSKA
jgi:hypothetical protein